MPRKRMIDPEYWSDEEIGKWSFQARLFYIGLWNFADDEGRFKAHPSLLKAQIFPYDRKIDLIKLKKEVSTKIQWYEVNSNQYGFIRNFLKYQRIDKPSESKLPKPQPFDEYSTNPPRIVPPNISKEKLSKEKLKEDNSIDEFFYLKDQIFNKTFKDYLQMRKEIKKPASQKAQELALKELHKYDIQIAIKILEQSILNSWQGIFPLKQGGRNGGSQRSNKEDKFKGIGTEVRV